jgi:energy-coupling factor transporter ATP-binding protein EcfA2
MSAVITEVVEGESLTEKEAFADILQWSTERPAWQRDALRRLVLNETLSESDFDELVTICISPEVPPAPLTSDHLKSEGTSGEPIALVRVADPTGINALPPEQALEFAKHGLTIIYGDNGSGKSGYVRILKHACRTRDGRVKILRDIEDTARTPQSARLVFARGDAEVGFEWTPDGKGNPELPAVSIFDTRSANIHVEKTNAVAYIPAPMQVLEALANACDVVKGRLDKQINELLSQTPHALKTPSLQRDTAAGAFVHGISAKSNLKQLELLASLKDEDLLRLSQLESDLGQDPKRAAARIQGQKTKLDGFKVALEKLCAATSDVSYAQRDALRADRDRKAEAARLASEGLFAASPLPDVGKEIWRELWEAARKYSDHVAYPTKRFPEATADEDLCVLCQQPLGKSAIDRRWTFETFVKGTTKTDEENAVEVYRAFLKSAVSARISVRAVREAIAFFKTDLGDDRIAESVRRVALGALWRLRAFSREATPLMPVQVLPVGSFSQLDTALSERITQLSADEKSPERAALLKAYYELKDRESLRALLDDIRAEIDRQKQIARLEKAAKDTAKRPITNKNKELSDKLVTNALRGRFAREVEKLKLSRMPVELRKIKDQNAVSFFQVCLIEKPDEPVGEILSEGEHRCIALAAFLAELVTSKQYSGIVFDDPMSSLDHIHRKAVAARLIEEAAHRQVIVFTHDLTFLYELRREAEAKSQDIHYQTIRRRSQRPGYVEGDLPNKAKSALQLANALRSELKDIKHEFDGWPDVRRTVVAKGIIEQLREAWDQGIADFIYPVLGRFDNHIKGGSLYKIAVIKESDVVAVTNARSRLSEDLHASAETMNAATVGHADLVSEVKKLEDWVHDIYERQKSASAPAVSYT